MSLLPLSYHCHARQPPREPHLPPRTSQPTEPVGAVDERCRASRRGSTPATVKQTDEGIARANQTVPTPICFRSP